MLLDILCSCDGGTISRVGDQECVNVDSVMGKLYEFRDWSYASNKKPLVSMSRMMRKGRRSRLLRGW